MPEYQLQIKQVVDYPRCRIYREFIHKLINDRSIRINGGSGLFHFTVLCSYANFRTSYRRIDGISYTVSPGEWVCTVKELSCWFRTRFHRQALSMLDTLQKQHLISYTLLGRGNVVKYKILHWARHNSALEYNAPCQKDTGFFFLPVSVALELVSSARCSEMDIVLDLCVSAVYNDTQVQDGWLQSLLRLMDAGIRVTVNTDNMTVSGVTVREELQLMADTFGLGEQEIGQLLRNSADSAFLADADEKLRLKMKK